MPGDPLEQRRAVGPPRLTPAKEQDSAQIVAVSLDPCVRARKAAHDPLTARRKRTKTGRPFDRVGQDQMDMAPAFGHAAMLRPKGSDGQRERVEGGAISALFLGKFGGNASPSDSGDAYANRIQYKPFS